MSDPGYHNYDLHPVVPVPGGEDACDEGWTAIGERLRAACAAHGERCVLVVDTYHGVLDDELLPALQEQLEPTQTIDAADMLKSDAELRAFLEPWLGGDDPVFGRLAPLQLVELCDAAKLGELRDHARAASGLVLVYGVGASLIAAADILVYADMARWEIQKRMLRELVANLGADNFTEKTNLQYKRAFFIEWRAIDRHKQHLIPRWDFLLDSNQEGAPKLVGGDAVRDGLREAARRPFRVVPFFDPAPWGGQWMRSVCQLDDGPPNYGWCFDCVPEENSLLLGFGDNTVELPALDLVLAHPEELLGPAVHGRFGTEFPIRFDFLDTIGGGNLSLQVHPLTEYIQECFGMHYTQDESYYMLDVDDGATVYLGFKEGVDRGAFLDALAHAQQGGEELDAER